MTATTTARTVSVRLENDIAYAVIHDVPADIAAALDREDPTPLYLHVINNKTRGFVGYEAEDPAGTVQRSFWTACGAELVGLLKEVFRG